MRVKSIVQSTRTKLKELKKKLYQIERDLEEGNYQKSSAESEEMLQELEKLNQNFVKLLMSDEADQAIRNAGKLVKWEEELVNFLNSISEDVEQLEEALEQEEFSGFDEIMSELNKEIDNLNQERNEIGISEDIQNALMELISEEEIEEELKWFERAVEKFENEERILAKKQSSEKVEYEAHELRKIENNIPELEGQMEKLRNALDKHNRIRENSSDWNLDNDIGTLTSLSPEDQARKEELEELIDFLESVEDISEAYEDTATRREIIKLLAKLGALGGGGAKSSGDLPSLRRLSGHTGRTVREEGSERKNNREIEIGELKVDYKKERGGKQIRFIIELKNKAKKEIEAYLEIFRPGKWNQESMTIEKIDKRRQKEPDRAELMLKSGEKCEVNMLYSNVDSIEGSQIEAGYRFPDGSSRTTKRTIGLG